MPAHIDLFMRLFSLLHILTLLAFVLSTLLRLHFTFSFMKKRAFLNFHRPFHDDKKSLNAFFSEKSFKSSVDYFFLVATITLGYNDYYPRPAVPTQPDK